MSAPDDLAGRLIGLRNFICRNELNWPDPGAFLHQVELCIEAATFIVELQARVLELEYENDQLLERLEDA